MGNQMPNRRIALVALAWIGAALVAQAAMASQGLRYRGSGSDDGTRANVTGSATNNSAGTVSAWVAELNAAPTGGADRMLQVGEIKQTASYTTDCGTGSIGLAVERDIAGSTTCDVFFASFGSNHRLAVVRGSSGWSAYEDGSVIDGPFSLGYTGGYSVARAESYWSSTGPAFSFTWGPSGYTDWQYSTNEGSSYTTISSATAINNGGWTVDAPPSPFTISR